MLCSSGRIAGAGIFPATDYTDYTDDENTHRSIEYGATLALVFRTTPRLGPVGLINTEL